MYPTLFTTPGVKAFAEAVDAERQAQLTKWGDQRHADGTGSESQQDAAKLARLDCQDAFGAGYGTWCHILFEEVREALAESDPAALRTELIQAAAVIAAWVSDLDRRATPAAPLNVSPTAALLASRCDACRHTLNWHRNDVGCTVVLCVCSRFQPPADEEASDANPA